MEGQRSEWLRYARDDLEWSRSALRDKLWSRACFASQQAAEKALKAFLVLREVTVGRTHDLPSLLAECCDVDPSFERLRDACDVLTDFYLSTRYPDDVRPLAEVTEALAREALLLATEVVRHVEERLAKQVDPSP